MNSTSSSDATHHSISEQACVRPKYTGCSSYPSIVPLNFCQSEIVGKIIILDTLPKVPVLASREEYMLITMEGGETLADSLLDDLGDLSDGDESRKEEQGVGDMAYHHHNHGRYDNQHGDAITEDNSVEGQQSKPTDSAYPAVKRKRRRILDSVDLKNHLKAIRKSEVLMPSSTKDQREDEYQLIVQSNKQLGSLAEELARAHGVLCTCYRPKFSELEELLPNPIQYKNAVRVIWNEMDIAKVSDDLANFLNNNQVITLSVAGSTTSGRTLTGEELKQLEEAVSHVEGVLEVQNELTYFVESRMEALAPSVCILVGPSTAAKLIGLAGGLAELSKIPSCNLQVLGQVKHNSASRAGLSSLATRPHQGLLSECDLVQSTPKALQRKVLKTVASKLALAARCDFVNLDAGRARCAAPGQKFREEIETKINQWQEPDKAPVLKALPK